MSLSSLSRPWFLLLLSKIVRPSETIRVFAGANVSCAVFALHIAFMSWIFLPAHEAEARPAVAGDLPTVVELDQIDLKVDAKGHARYTRLLKLRIINDQGRESESVQTIPFNGRSTTLRILDARTINGGKAKKVLPKNIEFKEVGDSMNSFDAQKQAIVAFPDVQIGSIIELRYEQDYKEVPIEGFWSSGLVYGQDYIETLKVRIRSELPLYYWKNDQKGVLNVEQRRQGKIHFIDVSSVVPIANAITQEEEPFLRSERALAITFSSLPNWESYAKSLIPVHEQLLARPLPPQLAKIRDEAAKEKTVLDKLQRVTALISQDFRYFGDWRRRNGGYIPRSIAEIDETRYGDCKDLSLATTAIYRALGLKANIAWIWRGEVPLHKAAYTLPVDTFFNHAITRVEAEGKTYWIDATNPVSYGKSTFSDIAGRPAFVLDAKRAFLDETPELAADSAVYESEMTYELQGNQNLKVAGEVRLFGRSAIPMAIKGFYGTVEKVNYELIRILAMYGKVLDYTVGDFERRSRIVSDLKIPFQFTLDDIGLRTSAGFGFPLMREDVITRLMTETKDRVSDIYLEVPNRFTQRTEIANVKRVGKSNLDCELKSDWVNLSRKVTDTRRGVQIDDRIDVLKAVIPNESLKTSEFENFQRATRNCFNRAAVILEKR